MPTWDDVRQTALALPQTAEQAGRDGLLSWAVADKMFVWERPLRRSDLAALGDTAPQGAILGVRVADLGVKEAVLAEGSAGVFTTPHFNGYPAVLVHLEQVDPAELEELIIDAWLARAPKRLAKDYQAPSSAD
jgi:hypothetical protein